jgi:two-component system sensor histidine kinase DesK
MSSLNKMSRCLQEGEAPAMRKHQWIWWVFSLYYFIPLFYIDYPWWKILLIFLAFLAFLFICVTIAVTEFDRAWLPISALVLLSVVTSPLTPGAATFFSYVGFFMGFCLTTRQMLIGVGLSVTLAFLLHLQFKYAVPTYLMPAVIGLITIGLVGRMERLRIDNKLASARSEEEIRHLATIAERERIARDLHDLLGHTLSSVVLKAELADKLLQQNNLDAARQQMQDLHKIARESLSLVRQTVSGYKHRGLTDEVMQLCDKLREHGFSVHISGEIPAVPPKAETALILALTELTTNIMRHSKGNHCQLQFEQLNDKLQITVADNGRPEAITPGNGLTGIRERLQALAGEIYSDIEQGCRFVITLPLEAIQ